MGRVEKTVKPGALRGLALIAILFAGQSLAQHPVTMWEVQGENNRIYLLGSIHLLRSTDYPLPAPIYDAYADAETLIMELDMDDMDQGAMQAVVVELGINADGETLENQMGPAAWSKAQRLAARIEIPLDNMTVSKPWLAAMSIEIILMRRMGFDASQGIESHLTSKALRDNKEVLGLETERQQIEILAGLSPAAQRDMLLQILEEGHELEDMLDELIDAWRIGDISFMESAMLDDMSGYRELYAALVVNRNRNWIGQIEPLLNDDDDYLIVVGALHLIGRDGVPELLRARGHDVQQMNQATPQNH